MPHSYNSRYAHNRAGQASGSKRPRAAKRQRQCCCSCPQRSGPQLLHAAAAARAGLRSVVGGISARSCCTVLQQHGPGKAGRPPSRAPAPAHPAQRKQRQSRACRPGFPCCCSIEKTPPGDKAGGAFLLPASTSRTKTAFAEVNAIAQDFKEVFLLTSSRSASMRPAQ